jgi:hypothetical protein
MSATTRIPASKMLRLLFATAFLAVITAAPVAVSAATSVCPDGMAPMFVIIDPDLAKKDRNGNLIMCAKFMDDGAKAGPDDKPAYVVDDIVL